ncbi:RHS repeat-associated core domain-containing protein [Nitrosomonas aestuarii]|uniref:RHS repeat-associated core domain-containing protein n=1 Tax=Nitrosomonas aestuarii TaxID=52441 RepID=UPI000D314B12|nr:RHS repeat-associated core domain-containing protein [Nitrosomonas aestuarii]PTN12731.1 RHS repeat-associated protein [Nitrosomonas aestuarii]
MVFRFACNKLTMALLIALFLLIAGISESIADTSIPEGTQIQPPTRTVWIRGLFPSPGTTEQLLKNTQYYLSPVDALDPLREGVCLEQGGPWLCRENAEIPGHGGLLWGFKFCRPYEPDYCGTMSATLFGVCPSNIHGLQAPSPFGGGWRQGYIACPVPSYPDGEKDLVKPEACGERTPHPVYIALGRKELTIPVYSAGNGVFPIDFQLFYQHNDNKRSGVAWRHTYYKSIVLDGQDIPTSARVYRGKGALLFNKQPDTGEWVGDSDINDSLIEVVDENNQRTGWFYIDRFKDSAEYYDATGKLISVADRRGLTHTLTYNKNGNLESVTDVFGQQLQFMHDDHGNFASLIDPSGNIYQFSYEASGSLASVTYPDGKTRSYHYNETAYTSGANLPHALTGITDENGVRYATYTYDTAGRAIVTEHAGGADRYQLSYNPDGNSTLVTDPLGSQYTHQFQTILGVAKSIGQSQPGGSGCSAASSAINYDINGNVASRTDFNGNKTCYAHDLNHNLEIARVEGLFSGSACPDDLVNYSPEANSSERKMLTDWHLDFRLPVRVTEVNRETTINYDTYGNVTQLSIHDTGSNETRTWNTRYTYHSTVTGVIVQRIIDGPRTDVNDITTVNYYAPDAACDGGHFGCRGQVMRITNALGHATNITRYNAHGQPAQIVDANNLTTTLTYDARQRLVSRVTGTETTAYQYDNVGQLIQLTRPDGSAIHFTYDTAHRLTEIADSLGNAIRYTLDAAGNRAKEEIFDAVNALVQTRQHEFDALSRLWRMVGAQNQITEFAYDANGNLKQTVDPLSHTSTRQFDALNRLIQANDPMGGQTLQQYDARDQIVQVTDPKGIATRYTTNVFGDVLHEVSHDRGTTSYTYDAAGNQLTRTDARGVVQTTAYDVLNRPIFQSYNTVTGVPVTKTTTWKYDNGANGIGRLTGMTDESGSTRYQYDVHGRLLNKIQTVRLFRESFTHAINYQYDVGGRLIRVTYPSGAQIDYAYGMDGRPTEVRVNGDILMQNITYRPFGEPQSWHWGTGRMHSRSYDLDGRLTQHPLGANAQTLTYDAAGRITNTSHINPVYNHTYEYDTLNRLIRQTGNASTRLWGYDANSNRILEQSGTMVYPYTIEANSNRLLSVAGPVVKNYSYDAAGNALSDGIMDFSWNAAGRLSSVSSGGEAKVFSLYNGHGERTLKWHYRGRKTAPTIVVYDSDGKFIGDYNKSENSRESNVWRLNQETVWFGDIPVAVIKQTVHADSVEIYTIDTDHLNTPRVIVDSTDVPVWLWHDRNAFGDSRPDEDPDSDGHLFKYNLRFAGQYFDSETHLHYNYFRDYEPQIGRYLSSDPIGLAGGVNTYGYVNANPLSFTDPTGEAIPALIAACAGNPACAAAISAGVGAFSGAAINLASQLFSNGVNLECVDKGQVAFFAVTGAIPSGATGLLGGKILSVFFSNKRVFWSGPGSREAAEFFAKANGGKTLEMTLMGKVLDKITTPGNFSYMKLFWNVASKNFARSAKGSVDVFHSSKGVRLESVWATKEFPIIKKKGNNINFHIVE